MSESNPGQTPGIRPMPTPTLRPQVVVPKTPGLAPKQPVPAQPIPVQPAAQQPPRSAENEPLELIEEDPGTAGPSKIRTIGLAAGQWSDKHKRKTNATGQGAARVRSFHGRLSEEGLVFLDDKINEWLDAHPDIEVKFVTSTIGQFEGKVREVSLVLNVWY